MREVEYASRNQMDLLLFYNEQWLHFQFSAKVLDGICRYLNRSFKKQAQEATSSFYEIKTDDVFVIYNLALSIWRDLFFSKYRGHGYKAQNVPAIRYKKGLSIRYMGPNFGDFF